MIVIKDEIMSFSTNSILHQTDHDGFYGILKDRGFRCVYCVETLLRKHSRIVSHVPMVSFSDIPFSNLGQYLDLYGEYIIGISKDWARSVKMNPVLYLDSNSHLLEFLEGEIHKTGQSKIDISLRYFIAFSKNYESQLIRSKKSYQNYRFSDEREWRIVPLVIGTTPIITLSTEEFEDKKVELKEQAWNIMEKFFWDDLRYLIVPTEDEALKLKTEFSKYPLLNIFTTEQVRQDFIGGNANAEIDESHVFISKTTPPTSFKQ